MAKYEGREALLERRVPHLGCLWNDVVFFSAVDIRRIKAMFEAEGVELGTWRWFEVPVDRLDPKRTVITSRAHLDAPLKEYGDFGMSDDAFEFLTPEALAAAQATPTRLREHIRKARSKGRRPLMFVSCPHVLYEGEVDLAGVPVVEG